MFPLLRFSLGVIFTILGVVGSVLPIMQGWIFFLLAVLMFFPKSSFATKAIAKIEHRMPRVAAWVRRMSA